MLEFIKCPACCSNSVIY